LVTLVDVVRLYDIRQAWWLSRPHVLRSSRNGHEYSPAASERWGELVNDWGGGTVRLRPCSELA